MVLPLALSFMKTLAVVLFVLVCLAIILIILLQKGRGGGIGAAFGGGGAGSLLGTKTGDFLTWVTICLVAVFLVMAVLMGKFLGQDAPDMGPVPTMTSTEPAAPAPAAQEAAAAVEEAAKEAAETAAEAADTTAPVIEQPAETTN